MPQSFVTNLCNMGTAYESVMLKDSLHGTLCAIHNTVNSGNDFPCSQHQMLQLCPAAGRYCRESRKPLRPKNASRSKSRSKSRSPNRGQKSNCQSVNPQCQNWATTLRTTSTYHKCKNNTGKNVTEIRAENQQYPLLLTTSLADIQKMNTLPVRTCPCVSKSSTKSVPTANKRCSIKSHNSLQVSTSVPVNSQMAQHILCTEDVVSELKDEIDKVKNKLEQISISKSQSQYQGDTGEPARHISQLKAENKQLKREVDQKKKLYLSSVKEVEKAKDILSDYEKKVALLHQQAVKSTKVMRHSKEKFCKCLKDKENVIKELKQSNEALIKSIKEKEIEYEELNKTFGNLQGLFRENSEQFVSLSEKNQNFCECIKLLENQLLSSLNEAQEYKEEIRKLEQQISDYKCSTCPKLETKARKQKEKYENRIKEHEEKERIMKNEISVLSSKIEEVESQKSSFAELETRCSCLQAKLVELEECSSRCKYLETEYQRQQDILDANEKKFEQDREELRGLVDELTNVVKENKVTLLQLSEINKQQEALIMSQSAVLSEKEEQMKMAESEIGMLRKRSYQLEEEINDLRKILSEPCSRATCLSLSNEVQEMKTALSLERDNKLVKEKIIEDQSQTICSLQDQIKEKMSELSKAREESNIAEEGIIKINDVLVRKHRELEREMDEKEHLKQKLKKLEYQKSTLSHEMSELEVLLHNYYESQKYNQIDRDDVLNLQKEVAVQKREWELQKTHLADEKEKAVSAAKFATQKLLDTVADFQKQVEAQKKVQTMLTRMLHDKEEELKIVKYKMSSINSIAKEEDADFPVDEIYRRNQGIDLSNPTTVTSFNSSCSNCCSRNLIRPGPNYQRADIQHLFNMLTRTEEEPIRDA